jgi:hypothetical protein
VLVDLGAEHRRDRLRLFLALRRDLHVEVARQDLSRLLVLEPAQDAAEDAEARRHDSARVA